MRPVSLALLLRRADRVPADETRSGGAAALLLERRLLWLVVGSSALVGLLLTAASFMLTHSVVGAAVVAVLVFLFVSQLWLVKRHYEINHEHGSNLFERARRPEKSYHAILQVLRTAVDSSDFVAAGQSDRVSELTVVLGRQLGLHQQALRDIRLAATLHDIGRLGVAEAVLSRPGPLTNAEWARMREHPKVGYEMLKLIEFLKGAADVMYAHHEHYDGTGYPRGLRGEEILLGARIFAVVDAYDAMTSNRPYRRARSHHAVVQEISSQTGRQFDPRVVSAFLDAEKEGLLGDHRSDDVEQFFASVAQRLPGKRSLLHDPVTAAQLRR